LSQSLLQQEKQVAPQPPHVPQQSVPPQQPPQQSISMAQHLGMPMPLSRHPQQSQHLRLRRGAQMGAVYAAPTAPPQYAGF
jgi:hypothetical protein